MEQHAARLWAKEANMRVLPAARLALFAAALGLLGALLLVPTTASAPQTFEETKPPDSGQIQRHVHNYGEIDRSCLRWTDQCRICSRTGGCSNIGIACQPAEVECLEHEQAQERKDIDDRK
jgi:hypothetical protein